MLYSKDGKPLHSWRVLILPQLDENTHYKEFRLDEPWDSPHNLPLLQRMPRVYAAPKRVDDPDEPNTTYLQVFVGDGAAFRGT